MPIGSPERERVDQIVNRLGDEGKAGSDGNIKVKLDGKIKGPANYNSSTRTIKLNVQSIKSDHQGTNALGHEVGHDEYYRQNGKLESREDREATERSAYGVGRLVDIGLGKSELFPDIEDGVKRSVESACKEDPNSKSCK